MASDEIAPPKNCMGCSRVRAIDEEYPARHETVFNRVSGTDTEARFECEKCGAYVKLMRKQQNERDTV